MTDRCNLADHLRSTIVTDRAGNIHDATKWVLIKTTDTSPHSTVVIGGEVIRPGEGKQMKAQAIYNECKLAIDDHQEEHERSKRDEIYSCAVVKYLNEILHRLETDHAVETIWSAAYRMATDKFISVLAETMRGTR